MEKKVLITGFEPFGGEKINPATEILNRLPEYIGDAKIIKLIIPTVFKKASERVTDMMDIERPDVVISIGQAGGRKAITVERVAINVDDALIEDNEGNKPIDEVIREDGENAYFTTLPIKKICQEIKLKNIEAAVSNSAGTFVCNHVMYSVLYKVMKDNNMKNVKAGFIHVPYLPEQVKNKDNMPSMELDDMVRAIKVAIKTAIVE